MNWRTKQEFRIVSDWHPWFAWYPVSVITMVVDNHTTHIQTLDSTRVWLEYVDRKVTIKHFTYENETTIKYAPLGTHTKEVV